MNILIVGDQLTGKTSYVERLVYNRFSESYITTMGKDLYTYMHNDQKIFIHDCSGTERYYKMISMYFNSSDGIIIFINDKTEIKKWLGLIPEKTPYVVVANRQPAIDEKNVIYIDTKNNTNVHKPLDVLVKKIPPKIIEETQWSLSYFIDYILNFINFT